MTFEFQLLGLLLMFLLIMVYYGKKDSFTKGNKLFRSILLITYIMQLVNASVYIAIANNSNGGIFSNIYFLLVFLWFVFYDLYYLSIWFKTTFKNDSFKLKNITKKVFMCFGGISLLLGILVLLTPVKFINGYFDYNSHIVSFFIWTLLLVELLTLIFNYKNSSKYISTNLAVILLIQFISFFLQTRSEELPFLTIGMIFTVYYCYFMLENNDKQRLKNVILERDYARKQSIDKINFLKILSHEIRIPLNTIDGFSQVIVDSNDMDEIKTDVSYIRTASRDLIDVINGMIDLSILDSGNLEILEENYNVYDMFDDIKNIIESKMRDKNVEFKVDIDNDIPEVLLGDPERLSQVILNLLTNAIKYTDKGSITLKVDNVKSSSRCRLKIMVIDTGIGIKKEDLATIFEGKTGKEGVTLGLAVSKYLLELMGGNIEVESTYGTGSKFIVTIDQKIITDHREEKVSRKRILKPFKATGKRILLVDDNKMNLKVAVKLLQPYDVEVVETLSGRECLDIIEKDTKFDLILMDDMMPEMSGGECLNILKKIERVDGFYIPVVVLTANALSGVKEKYLKLGFEDYLAKPIDKYELDRILKKYLKNR